MHACVYVCECLEHVVYLMLVCMHCWINVMYVSMRAAYVFVYIYIYIHTISTYTHMYMRVCMHAVHLCTYPLHVRMHVHMQAVHVCICVSWCMCICMLA